MSDWNEKTSDIKTLVWSKISVSMANTQQFQIFIVF